MPNDQFHCLCPDGMKSEANECKCPDGSTPDALDRCPQHNESCEQGSFACSNGLCIPELWKCDGDDDCGGEQARTSRMKELSSLFKRELAGKGREYAVQI